MSWGGLSPGVLGERHHHRFGDDQAARQVEVAAHALSIDDQAFEHEAGLAQRAARGDERFGDRDPFELPGAGGTLVVRGHGVEHQAGVLTHDLGSR